MKILEKKIKKINRPGGPISNLPEFQKEQRKQGISRVFQGIFSVLKNFRF